jgi:hypothetical protein
MLPSHMIFQKDFVNFLQSKKKFFQSFKNSKPCQNTSWEDDKIAQTNNDAGMLFARVWRSSKNLRDYASNFYSIHTPTKCCR